ncbi:hypothetical protein LCGC14_2974500, partial [marine sediment metagenome]
MKTIEIVVTPQGETRVQTLGFTGSSCRDASQFIERALGQQTGERLTRKLYQTLSAELRGRTTWTIDTDTLREVRIVAGKEVLHLRRDGDQWVYPKDPFVKIDPAAVSRYLDRIKTGKAQSFADYKTRNLHKYRLNKPWYVLELTDRVAQVGIRSFSREELDACGPQVARFITPQIVRAEPDWIDRT